MKKFFPGKMQVSFRKGPSGYLRQDPSEEAQRIKENPSPQDKSAPQKEDLVKTNAHTEVFLRGGVVSDRLEVLGEYILQFGKYKGKSFRWLLENDVGYTLYLINKVEQEQTAGQFNPTGDSKDSLLSFLEYTKGFQEIEDLRRYSVKRPAAPVASDHDNLVRFGSRAKSTWGEIWNGRTDGYAAFIMGKKCVQRSKMHNLQQYLMKQRTLTASTLQPLNVADSNTTSTPASDPPVIEDDEYLERAMLSLSPSKFGTQLSSPAVAAVGISVSSTARG